MTILVIAILAGIICLPFVEDKSAARRSSYKSSVLGHPFTLNGKTYIGVHLSSWDGTVKCISETGPELWVDGAVILNALKVEE